MKVQGLSEKAMRFRLDEKYFNISTVSDSGVLIRFVEIDGWVRVMMEVGEDTGSDALREAIPLALCWRDRLLEWQGPWMRGGDNPFLEELCLRQESGERYGSIAGRINRQVEALLQEFLHRLEEFEAAKPNFKTMFDFYMWQPKANQFSLEHARVLLRAVRIKDDEIEDLLQSGLDNLRAGKPVFDRGYPLSRERLIRTLRTWREGSKQELYNQKRSQTETSQE
jgi:hypothetical protein